MLEQALGNENQYPMVYNPNSGLFKKKERRLGTFGASGRVVVDENPETPPLLSGVWEKYARHDQRGVE
jgi:hypothetical protein